MKVTRLDITPATHVRATKGDAILFRIPAEKRQPASHKRVERLQKYNDYKTSLHALAKGQGFVLPSQGAFVKFYIPIPESWPDWKKETMSGTLHQRRPDIDNFLKALFDSLFTEDNHIGHIEAVKLWVNKPSGWIEITENEPEYVEIPIPKSKKEYLMSFRRNKPQT